jgi:RNA polymerase sigma factor (sigma-70 family)
MTSAKFDERDLLIGLKGHNHATFCKLYNSYSGALLNIICRIVKHEEESEDVLQETFIKIMNNIHLYDSNKATLFTWMSKVARNKSLDHMRTVAVRNGSKTIQIDHLNDKKISEPKLSPINIDTIGVRQLTANLITTHQEVINLMYFQGYTQVEVADQLAIPLGTVKTRARMAILELRKQFKIKDTLDPVRHLNAG